VNEQVGIFGSCPSVSTGHHAMKAYWGVEV
jgi:hypothetical protein